MVSIQEAVKIGEVNFQDYKTDFYVMPQVKDYFESEMVSLATLIPDGWLWYESTVFDELQRAQEEDPDIDFGKEFRVIYTGVTDNRPHEDDAGDFTFNEVPEDISEILFGASSQSVPNQDFFVKYITVKK